MSQRPCSEFPNDNPALLGEWAGESADSFLTLRHLFEDVARASGATEELVAAVRGLLEEKRPDRIVLPEASVDALVAGTLVERTPQGIARTERFERTVVGWRRVLRAETDDFADCGAAALDEWGADLIARLLGTPALSRGLQRELRQRGVAAFGLV